MTNSVVVWDRAEQPINFVGDILLWQGYSSNNKFLSIPGYIEEHANDLRAKYLAFIHDLGETDLKGKKIVEHLDIGDDFSLWWMTTLAEKSPFKSPKIYDCLRLIALEGKQIVTLENIKLKIRRKTHMFNLSQRENFIFCDLKVKH